MTSPVSERERTARAELTWLSEPGDGRLRELAYGLGAVQAMEVIRSGRYPAPPAAADAGAALRAVTRWRQRLERVPQQDEVRRALDRFRLICPGDPEWPAGLDNLGTEAPVALWARGDADLRFSCQRSVTVTGARAATAYGCHLAAEFGASLGAQGHAVVCGGSFGVDAAAHRGALSAGGVTIAVLPGGLDVPYPAAHERLFAAIAAQGALVSEAPPGTVAGRLRFQARNRITAALGTATVIVEAGTRSSAMTIARCARELGRPLMAVPGPVASGQSAGCHELIQSRHAVLVTSAADVTRAIPGALPADG